jgi:hypothetical protein
MHVLEDDKLQFNQIHQTSSPCSGREIERGDPQDINWMINLFVSHRSQTTENLQKQHWLYPSSALLNSGRARCVKFDLIVWFDMNKNCLTSSARRDNALLRFPGTIVTKGVNEPSRTLEYWVWLMKKIGYSSLTCLYKQP